MRIGYSEKSTVSSYPLLTFYINFLFLNNSINLYTFLEPLKPKHAPHLGFSK